MKYLIGFTNVILGYLQGTITEADLSEGLLRFSCPYKHVLGLNPGIVPYETTWANEVGDPKYDAEAVSVELLDPQFRAAVSRFTELVAAADREGRMEWKIGNQPAYLEGLARTDPKAMVYWRNHWCEAVEYRVELNMPLTHLWDKE